LVPSLEPSFESEPASTSIPWKMDGKWSPNRFFYRVQLP
jgi:hypothetical protein